MHLCNRTSKTEIGIGDSEKMAVVKKMFKCQPTEVMTIRTENRDFYLIGTDRSRSKSSPACLDEKHIATVTSDEQFPGNQYVELETTASKKRPTSEPIHPFPIEQDHVYESPRKLLLRLRHLEHTPLDKQSGEDYEMEGHYATPRSVLAKLDDVITEFSSSDEEQHNSNGIYMTMKDLSLAPAEGKLQSTSTDDKLPTIPPIKGNSRNPLVKGDSSLKPTALPRKVKPEKTPKISCLSVVQLSIILDKITDDTELQEVEFLLPQSDFTNCLTLTEASGHI
ncbi:hypothetical protein JD844_006830 [Phrynosoma platyrhinos]|uniref:Uncharacterized protein n=1 Tax=Phrynosoma platyrhinos TaxID=52577 RepID=A0ABQ7T2B2_PHRPL|nr:hypothetical protein JD844_006830 [Phrynosoma platyrhinos]